MTTSAFISVAVLGELAGFEHAMLAMARIETVPRMSRINPVYHAISGSPEA
jgi:hypothetical protein